MAERVTELPPSKSGRMQGASKYPWSEWLDGTPWKGTLGVDFKCKKSQSVRTHLANEAKRRGLKVKTRVVGKDIFWQATKVEPAA